VSDGPSLCTVARNHFVDVYSGEGKQIVPDSPLYESLPKLSQENQNSLDAKLSRTELRTALHELNKGKSPGIDGLTPEFYQFFWKELQDPFHEVFESAIASGTLPHTAQKSVLNLLPKSGDRLEIKNWRPISLLTTDYKILARALATRLKGVLSALIHPDQGYCVPGRTIFDNLHLHRDVLEYANQSEIPLALLSLDQQGAFDKVDHAYLFHALSVYGFGEGFGDGFGESSWHTRIPVMLAAKPEATVYELGVKLS
jgi:hypothetical protein